MTSYVGVRLSVYTGNEYNDHGWLIAGPGAHIVQAEAARELAAPLHVECAPATAGTTAEQLRVRSAYLPMITTIPKL